MTTILEVAVDNKLELKWPPFKRRKVDPINVSSNKSSASWDTISLDLEVGGYLFFFNLNDCASYFEIWTFMHLFLVNFNLDVVCCFKLKTDAYSPPESGG